MMMNLNKLKRITPTTIIVYLILTIAAVYCIAPFILMLSASFSDEMTLLAKGYKFLPRKISLEAYNYLWNNASYLARAYGITILITAVGVVTNVLITMMLGYACSRRDLPGNRILNLMVIFTMLFYGGLVPTYLVYSDVLQIKNTLFALLIPTLLMSGFNVMLARSYFQTSVPYSIIEAARIDGAGEFKTYVRVVLPLSWPITATIGLFAGVRYWNDWFNGMIYLTNTKLFSIQNVLNSMLANIQFLKSNTEAGMAGLTVPAASVRMAIAAVAVVPILIAYPIFQKYFVKGIALGGVKE